MSILLGYRRKSMVRDQTHLISPERQARSCELWAELQPEDYTIEWYEDIEGHRSGRDEKGRPGWQDLMAQIDRPDVAGVIADSFDRMYRNVHQFLNFLAQLEAKNKKLITVKEGLDSTSTLGRAIVTILMVIYQLESDQTSDRMAANVKYKREVLGRHWGPAPFGCERNEQGHLVPLAKTYWLNTITGEARLDLGNSDHDQWQQRRFYDGLVEMYRLYSSGQYSYDTVADLLNKAGWRYCTERKKFVPRPFSRDDVRRGLSMWQLFKGELPLGNITRGDGPILEGGHQPILPVELCELVGRIRERRNRQYSRRRSHDEHFYLLSGILYCGVCQRDLRGYFRNGRRRYRHYGAKQGCTEKWLLADDIEGRVLGEIERLANHELMAEVAATARRLEHELFARDDSTRPLLAELDRQRDRLTRLENLYLDGEIEISRYRLRQGEINQAIAELEDKLYHAVQTVNFNQVIERIFETFGKIATAEPATKKALIHSIFERLEVANGELVRTTPRPWAKPFF